MRQIHNNLYLIDLDQALKGYRKFISTWLYRIEGVTVLVDPGPSATIPMLVDELRRSGIDSIEFVLLTHIHLDHAGGLGRLLQYFPDIKVNCHPAGIPHLVAPEKLWEESKKVLGTVAEVYGELVPVSESSVFWRESIFIGGTTIEAIETPGHAAHHVSYRIGDILFAGEVGGVHIPTESASYHRPATPPPFRFGMFRESIVKLAALDVSFVCYGHYGFSKDVSTVFESALHQLDFWVETVDRYFGTGKECSEDAILADIIAKDSYMVGWASLPIDIQTRERSFCLNSIRGIRGYLEYMAEKKG